MENFLRQVPLFSELTDEDLASFCSGITRLQLPAGAVLFNEGEMGGQAYVIQEGEIEIFKKSDGRSVLLAVRKRGEIIGEMSLLEASPRYASGRARVDSELLVVDHSTLDILIGTRPAAARTMLHTFSSRLRSMDLIIQQSVKMAQLGMLTAGIAHELNNPAAATRRGADQLQAALEELQTALVDLARFNVSEAQQAQLDELSRLARQNALRVSALDPLTRSDRTTEWEIWLESRGVEDAWEFAPILVDLDASETLQEILAELADGIQSAEAQPAPAEVLQTLLRWLGSASTVHSLLAEIQRGASRMSEIVGSLKSYSYLDQGEVQIIDVAEGLDNTLIMLRGQLKEGVAVHKDYARLPKIQAYGSELNQVWTNLLVNAIEAMNYRGDIFIRTRYSDPWVMVEIEDNGPGIPEEVRSKIFSPFFTTKPVGKGTGLGLHTSYNIIQKHGGDIRLTSEPGKTIFTITLPVDQSSAESSLIPPPDFPKEESSNGTG
jgi:signal transduction histidine kinase